MMKQDITNALTDGEAAEIFAQWQQAQKEYWEKKCLETGWPIPDDFDREREAWLKSEGFKIYPGGSIGDIEKGVE